MEICGVDCENSQKLCKNNTSETTGKGVMDKLLIHFRSIGSTTVTSLPGCCSA